MVTQIRNDGKNAFLFALYGYVYDLAQWLCLVQIHSSGSDGILRDNRQRSSVILYDSVSKYFLKIVKK